MATPHHAAALLTLTLAVTPALAGGQPATEIETAIRTQVTGSNVRVVDYDGIVIIKGSVSSAEDKAVAETIARESGRQRIANLVKIVPPATDEDLRLRIEREMDMLRAMGVTDLSLRISDGVVNISGNVAAESHRTVIDTLARVPGVRQVVIDTASSQP